MGTGLAFLKRRYILKFMARQVRYEYAGGVYYIKARGVGHEPIFRDAIDRNRFLEILVETVFRFKWLCHSYCLLEDHYHLILETPQGNLSKGMRQINGLYTQSFNRKYRRQGPLFGERFKSIIIEKARYLLPLHRHMMLNPVRVNLTRDPERWPWSSYLPNIIRGYRPAFLITQWILSYFSGKDESFSLEKYQRYIFNEEEGKFSWRDLRDRVFLGSDTFIERVKKRILVQKDKKRDMNYNLTREDNSPLEEIIGNKRLTRKERDVRIYDAYIHHGYTLNEIAAYLGVHFATVSRAVRRMEKRVLRQALQ